MMKILSAIVALFFPVIALAQTGFTLKATIQKVTVPAKAYLIYRSDTGNVIDSAEVKNGIFEIKGSITEPAKAMLVIDHQGIGFANLRKQKTVDLLNMYIEPGNINITGLDSVSRAKVSDSKINEEFIEYQVLLTPLNNELLNLKNEFEAATKEQQQSGSFRAGFQQRADLCQVIV